MATQDSRLKLGKRKNLFAYSVIIDTIYHYRVGIYKTHTVGISVMSAYGGWVSFFGMRLHILHIFGFCDCLGSCNSGMCADLPIAGETQIRHIRTSVSKIGDMFC